MNLESLTSFPSLTSGAKHTNGFIYGAILFSLSRVWLRTSCGTTGGGIARPRPPISQETDVRGLRPYLPHSPARQVTDTHPAQVDNPRLDHCPSKAQDL